MSTLRMKTKKSTTTITYTYLDTQTRTTQTLWLRAYRAFSFPRRRSTIV